jgi:hypothetical protein
MNRPLYPKDRFVDFCSERESIRLRRERGEKPPHSQCPILQKYRFCNIDREDDYVTTWVDENVRQYMHNVPMTHAVAAIFTARIFNEPSVLDQMDFTEFDVERWYDVADSLQESGKTVFRSAYLTVSKKRGISSVTYHRWITNRIEACEELNTISTLTELQHILEGIEGIGPFMANQVVADFRHIGSFKDAEDWETCVHFGPGTQRGLNRYFDRHHDTSHPEKTFRTMFDTLKEDMVDILEAELAEFVDPPFTDLFKDPNNLANALCEFDKYERAYDRINDNKKPTGRIWK